MSKKYVARAPLDVDGDAIIAGANMFLPSMGFTRLTLNRLIKEDPLYNDELSIVLINEEGTVESAVITAVDAEGGRAWFKLFFTTPDARDELRARLIQIMDRLRRGGVKEVRVSDRAGYHFRAGIEGAQRVEAGILSSLGFKPVRFVVDYEVDLRLFSEFRGRDFSVNGYRVRQSRSAEDVVRFVDSNFGHAWAREAAAAAKNGGVIEAVKDDGIVGFAAYSGLEREWFGPIGVLKEHRESGVGSNLLFAALTRMRENGVVLAVIPWTDHLTFYSKTNAIVKIRHLSIMRAELP